MKNLQEKKLHGRPDFPFAVYPGRLPEFGTGYPLHWHEELELIRVQSGSGTVTVQGRQVSVAQGDMVLVPPQSVHSIAGEQMCYHTILFRLSMLEQSPGVAKYTAALWDREKEKPCHLKAGSSLNQVLAQPVEELIRYRQHRDTAFDLLVYADLYRILYHLVESCGEAGAEQLRRHGNYEKLKEILEALKEDPALSLTVREAADRTGFSESHFMRLFRELTGTSFAQYVRLVRLDRAAEQLRTTGKRICDIAEETGFHNLSYFTRAFAEKYHMTPSSYRRQWRKKTES